MPIPLFSERLYPSLGTVLALSLSSPMVLLAALPFDTALAVALGIIVPLALIALAFFSAPQVLMTKDSLMVGKMNLPLVALGEARFLEGPDAVYERGPGLSPGSQRLFRGDIPSVVKILIDDPQDPTEYILFSSRKGAELVSALDANRTQFGL